MQISEVDALYKNKPVESWNALETYWQQFQDKQYQKTYWVLTWSSGLGL